MTDEAILPPLSSLVALGSVFADRYRVDGILGTGERKQTFLAWDTKASRKVALSVVASDIDTRATRQEVEMLGRAGTHDNIVTLYDFDLDSRPPYLVFEYLAGGQLRERCRALQSEHLYMPLAEVFRIARQICRALAQIHERGVIHRDISATNIWLDERSVAHLGDFDTAIALDDAAAGGGSTPTTEGYPAPELIIGAPQDARADFYSLGGVIHELLMGVGPQRPSESFRAAEPQLRSRHDVPPGLEALVSSMLAADPADRPMSAKQVLDQLRDIEATASLELLIANGENDSVEFKQTLRWDIRAGRKSDDVLHSSVKTICAFLNGVGGTLLIGVTNSLRPVGLEDDLRSAMNIGKEPDNDWFELTFRQALTNGLKPDMNHLVTVRFPLVSGVQICRLDVRPASEPIFVVLKNVPEFYVRQGNLSRALDIKAAIDYVRHHWGYSTG